MRCYQKENRISTGGLDSGRTVALGEKGVMRFTPARVKGYRSAEDSNSSVRGTPSLSLFFPSLSFELSGTIEFAVVKMKSAQWGNMSTNILYE